MTSGQMQQPQQEGMPDMNYNVYFPNYILLLLKTLFFWTFLVLFFSNALKYINYLAIKYWILDEKKIHAQIQQNKSKSTKNQKENSRNVCVK